jgi:Uncharacterized conserved protein
MTALLATLFAAAGERAKGNDDMSTAILLKFDGEELTVRLNDSPASRDFIAMLPMTLAFRDYNATEKISDLPQRLSVDGSPPGCTPSAGDFTYYAPWGNLAVFYRDFRYGSGLIPLGAIESGVEKLASMQGEFSVHVEVKQ